MKRTGSELSMEILRAAGIDTDTVRGFTYSHSIPDISPTLTVDFAPRQDVTGKNVAIVEVQTTYVLHEVGSDDDPVSHLSHPG